MWKKQQQPNGIKKKLSDWTRGERERAKSLNLMQSIFEHTVNNIVLFFFWNKFHIFNISIRQQQQQPKKITTKEKKILMK